MTRVLLKFTFWWHSTWENSCPNTDFALPVTQLHVLTRRFTSPLGGWFGAPLGDMNDTINKVSGQQVTRWPVCWVQACFLSLTQSVLGRPSLCQQPPSVGEATGSRKDLQPSLENGREASRPFPPAQPTLCACSETPFPQVLPSSKSPWWWPTVPLVTDTGFLFLPLISRVSRSSVFICCSFLLSWARLFPLKPKSIFLLINVPVISFYNFPILALFSLVFIALFHS